MTRDAILGLVRHLLTFGGGIAVAKGLADEATMTTVVSSLVAIAGAVWSVIDKTKKAASG